MPAEVLTGPPGISCLFADGRRLRKVVTAEPAGLVADLLTGLAGLVYPHGRVNSPKTADAYLHALADMARFMREQDFDGGAQLLTRGLLARYWMQAGHQRESLTRRMLVSFDDAAGRVLQADARALAAGRHFESWPSSSPLQPYTEAEWARLRQACRDEAGEAFARHRKAVRQAGLGEDPRHGGWTPANKRWLLMQHGPLTDAQAAALAGLPAWQVQRKHGGMLAAREELFPGAGVVIAYQLLLGIYTGIVPDGIDGLGLGDLDWAGDAAVLLSYVKGRTAAESQTLSRRAVRLLEQWLEHSALLRQHAPGQLRGSLWLYWNTTGPAGHWRTTMTNVTRGQWAARHGLPRVDRRRIRTTWLSLRDRQAWHGSARSMIDPNHTPAVEGDHYLTAATPAQLAALETITEDAQRDILGRARPPVVLTGEEAAELAGGFPALVADAGLDDAAIAGLLDGEQDVFTAACGGILAGLHGPKGKPCPARPWVCLLCPLALFAPRHAPNLLRLKAYFHRQWLQMVAEQFMKVFGPYSARVTEILDRFPAAVITAAAAAVAADAGDPDFYIPLRPEERTT